MNPNKPSTKARVMENESAKVNMSGCKPRSDFKDIHVNRNPNTGVRNNEEQLASQMKVTKRQKIEENKDISSKIVLMSRPIKSGELVCDEELSLEESSGFPLAANNHQSCNKQDSKGSIYPISLNDGLYTNILNYFLQKEKLYDVTPEILNSEKQPMLNWKMRALLIDWMIEVSSEFKLQRETLHLAVNLLDRYIDKVHNVPRRDYQLIGTSSLYLACKIEEIICPKIEIFILATDNGYHKSQILDMERKISMELEWKLTPTSLEKWMNMC